MVTFGLGLVLSETDTYGGVSGPADEGYLRDLDVGWWLMVRSGGLSASTVQFGVQIDSEGVLSRPGQKG